LFGEHGGQLTGLWTVTVVQAGHLPAELAPAVSPGGAKSRYHNEIHYRLPLAGSFSRTPTVVELLHRWWGAQV